MSQGKKGHRAKSRKVPSAELLVAFSPSGLFLSWHRWWSKAWGTANQGNSSKPVSRVFTGASWLTPQAAGLGLQKLSWYHMTKNIYHKLYFKNWTNIPYQISSVTQSCPTLCDAMNCSTPGFPVHHQLLEFTQTHVHWVSDAIQPSHSLLSPSSPAPIPPSIKVFSNVSTLRMRWPKYWSFSFSIISSKEIPGLISFRMNWLDLLAVQGTLKSLLKHHSSKTSILWCSAFSQFNSCIYTWPLEKP